MREPPRDLANPQIVAALATHYRLTIAELTFLPLGYDASAWVYRARATDGRDYFVKLRLRVDNEPSLIVPRALQDAGVARVVAPLRSAAGRLWEGVGGYALILYPFVDGATGMERPLTDAQWVAYGALLRQVHEVAAPPELASAMRHERFSPQWGASIRRVDAHIGADGFTDPAQDELARFWRARRAEIRRLLVRAEELGRRFAASAPSFVLCHADIHTGNMMTDAAGEVWFVDWDETLLAPRERDLMFAVGGGISRQLVSPQAEALFLQGYGSIALDPLALAYYRYVWAVGDIGSYGEQVFFRPDLGPETRREGVAMLTGLFKPGEIVSLALESEQ